jgi:hypothetical protein
MRDQVNEIYALLRERDMRRIGEKRHLENSLPRAQWKPVYAPILAYAGVLLSKAGMMLQERYTYSSDIVLRGETISE